MQNISLNLVFSLENGRTGKVVIKDVDANASVVDIQALVDEILTRDTIVNYQKPVKLVDCYKTITVDEKVDLSF